MLAALRFIRGIGGHDNISARKFLDAAKQTEDNMLFYTIFRFFEQRNQRLRGNPNFTPGEDRAAVTRTGVGGGWGDGVLMEAGGGGEKPLGELS